MTTCVPWYLTLWWPSIMSSSLIALDDHPYMHVAWYWYVVPTKRSVSYLTQTDMSALDQSSSLLILFFLVTSTTDGLSEALFKVLICFDFCFLFFIKRWFSKVTTNISSSNFVGFTKKSSKADSILDCASRCVYWEQKSSYCNAFRWNFKPSEFQTFR